MSDFSIIGKPTAMIDAAEKTTGAGKYTDDLSVPGMLVGKILHSPYPHARIKRIDTSRAEKLDGVVAVVVGKDAPNPYGILPVGHDEHALALDKVRYVGDNVACVVAVSEAIAEKALELIDVEYEVLPAYFDPEESMKAQTDLIHDNKPHNLEKDYHHVFGDPDKGFAEADQVAEARFIANEVTHAAMEPHSTLASFELDPHTGKPGRLTVWSSTQVPYYLQHKLSLVLEMPMSQIRVIKPLVGGGFGGKSEVIPLEIIAAVAARKAQAPVKITYTREEVFWAHRGRPRTIIDLKTGVKNDGRITAVKARVVQDGGAYCSYGVVTILYSGALLGALYDIPNIQYDGYRVLTNKPACGAMRGHGTVNVRFAFESQLDELAAKIGMDPAEIRQRNLLQPPCITVNGLRVQSYGLPECIEKTVERSGWKQRKGKLPKGRGLGIACSHYVSGAANSIIRSDMPHSTVNIKIDRDGGVVVYTGASEIGQGSDTMTAQSRRRSAGMFAAARASDCRRHRSDADRHRLLLQPRDLHGGECNAAGGRRSEEADRGRGGEEDGLRSRRISIFRDDRRSIKKGAVGNSRGDGRAPQWPSQHAANGSSSLGLRPRGRPDSARIAAAEAQRRRSERLDDIRRSRRRRHRLSRSAHRHRFLRASAGSARRQAQRRRRWTVAGLFLLGAGRRSQRRRRNRRSHGPQSLGRARLRARLESGFRRRPDHRLGLDGHGAGAHRRNGLERRHADESRAARISQPVVGGVARGRADHRGEHRSRRPVWREGMQRRIAGGNDSRDCKCDLRRGRRAPARVAVHAGASSGGAAREEECEGSEPDRRR